MIAQKSVSRGTVASMTGFLGLAAAQLGWAAPSASPDGAELYRVRCSACHGLERAGGTGPPLSGAGFSERWAKRSVALENIISHSMPLDAPGGMSKAQYAAISHYLLRANRGSTGARTALAPTAQPISLPGTPVVRGAAGSSDPDDAELLQPGVGDWLRYNRDFQGQRFSPLTQITLGNVATLVPKCIFQTGEVGSFQSSPIVRNGRMYITTPHSTFALDAATCRSDWAHEYVPSDPEPLPTNRGVILYKGLVIRGTTDGHLIALDALEGKLLWDVQVCDSHKACFISSAPVVFDGKLFIGEAGADFGAPGHVHAFNAENGAHLWTVSVVPGKGEPGAETWENGVPGGGSMWTTITIEPSSRMLFVSVGNPDSDFDGRRRPGDNLYTDSVIVLSADTGKLQWYLQQNPHDVHDWDTGAAPVIYEQDGHRFMAVGSKDARLYLYDRDTHALLARQDLARRLNDTMMPEPGVPIRFCPGALGGVEWNGPAYSPLDRMVYVNTVDWCMTLTVQKKLDSSSNPYGGLPVFDPPDEARGSLRAFDAATGTPIWSYEAHSPMVAGITPTASGLLFTGTAYGEFLVFDAKTGKQIYRFATGGAIAGGITTYLAAGKQYVAVPSGNSSKSLWQNRGAGTLIVFGLP
jgi:alcohol dehydrogenase (cytochrome c)